jgi:hypothetical protein
LDPLLSALLSLFSLIFYFPDLGRTDFNPDFLRSRTTQTQQPQTKTKMSTELKEEKKSSSDKMATDEEEEKTFDSIDKLQDHGINASVRTSLRCAVSRRFIYSRVVSLMQDIKKLKGEGLCTVASVIMNPTKLLTSIKGISDAKVTKILEAGSVCSSGLPFAEDSFLLCLMIPSSNENSRFWIHQRKRSVAETQGTSQNDNGIVSP